MIRKQLMLTEEQTTRLAALAKETDCSEGEIVRRALERYNPDFDEELLDVMIGEMSKRLKASIARCDETHEEITRTLAKLEKRYDGHR